MGKTSLKHVLGHRPPHRLSMSIIPHRHLLLHPSDYICPYVSLPVARSSTASDWICCSALSHARMFVHQRIHLGVLTSDTYKPTQQSFKRNGRLCMRQPDLQAFQESKRRQAVVCQVVGEHDPRVSANPIGMIKATSRVPAASR